MTYLKLVTDLTPPADLVHRQLLAAREITHAFLTANRPEDVYRLALERVTPLAGAAFASVYLVERGSDLLRLAASHDWPEQWRPWLGQMSVRVGRGPTGEAVAERRVVEIADVLSAEHRDEWREIATEVGFRSLVAIPLATGHVTLGALTFYFTHTDPLTDARRELLRSVADQMAVTAEKSALITELSRANAALREVNTELESRNAALVEARRVRDEFLTTITHELRTPLTAVIGYVSLLEEGINGPLTVEQRRDLAQVRRASDRLLSLVDDMLELATLKRSEAEPQRTEADPRALLQEAIDAIPAARRSVLLVVDVPAGEMASVSTDQRRAVRVLAALLDNSFKFTTQGEVRVSVRIEGNTLIYEISDTGAGIPEALHQAVFEEFRQADGTVTRRHGGAGLGLALARMLARLLGGDVTILESSQEGTSVRFTIPMGGEVSAKDAIAPRMTKQYPDEAGQRSQATHEPGGR